MSKHFPVGMSAGVGIIHPKEELPIDGVVNPTN